jgi:hypothetical protein
LGLNIKLLTVNGRGVSSVTDNSETKAKSPLDYYWNQQGNRVLEKERGAAPPIPTHDTKTTLNTIPPMQGLCDSLCKDDFEFVS